LLLAGVWFGKDKPNFQLFLEPFAHKVNTMKEGFQVQTPQGEQLVRCFTLTMTADNPTKDEMMNKVGYNGFYGCGVCESKGWDRKRNKEQEGPSQSVFKTTQSIVDRNCCRKTKRRTAKYLPFIVAPEQ